MKTFETGEVILQKGDLTPDVARLETVEAVGK